MNVLTFGSCLSECVARVLQNDFSADFLAKVVHFRTDQFLEYVVKGKHRLLPLEELQDLFIQYYD